MHPPYLNLFDFLFTGLSVTILGESYVRWQEFFVSANGHESIQTKIYSNYERYFEDKVIVYGFGKFAS